MTTVNTHIVAVHGDFLIYLEKDHYTCDLGIIVMYVIKDSSNKTIWYKKNPHLWNTLLLCSMTFGHELTCKKGTNGKCYT